MSMIMDMIVENEQERIRDALQKAREYAEDSPPTYRCGWLEALEFIKKELLGEEDEG